MLKTDNADIRISTLFSVGDRFGNYRPPGVLDGIAAFEWEPERLRIFVNHEVGAAMGYPWQLDNGMTLRGARVSYFDIDKSSRRIVAAGPAIRRIYDRQSQPVTNPQQINERPQASDRGLDVLCSSAGYRAGQFGFVSDILFVQEEATVDDNHMHGGTVWALNVQNGDLRALPELGRGSWENVTALATPDADKANGHIALLIGDDYEFGGAPLYLWLGRKIPDGNFIERNGLTKGQLHVWVSESGDKNPQDWNGSGAQRRGQFIPIATRDSAKAGKAGYDKQGYQDDKGLRNAAVGLGAFLFSRPEDLHTNPANGREVIFASTGHGRKFPADNWGALYLFQIDFELTDTDLSAIARASIIYDSDETEDFGIRNPDNLVWANDGMVYVQEDKAVKKAGFGASSGREASVWRIDPENPDDIERIAEIDRTAPLPDGATDASASVPGNWESSGILDVSPMLAQQADETVLLLTVQAHGVRDGAIGGRQELVEAGQLLMLVK